MRREIFSQYLRGPHSFCPGCGLGTLMNCGVRAFCELGWDFQNTKIVGVSGIGCAALLTPQLKTDVIHTTHGRAIPFAVGIKLARPELKVIVISGDGDIATIGGNHLIHLARRNIKIPVICANNYLYGMTGGQVGATTPLLAKTTTTPEGNKEPPFDLVALVLAAMKNVSGPKLVARYPLFPPKQLIYAIKRALTFDAFAFLEVVTPCPTHFGRFNPPSSPAQMLKEQKKIYISKERAKKMTRQELSGKIIFGDFGSLLEYETVSGGAKANAENS